MKTLLAMFAMLTLSTITSPAHACTSPCTGTNCGSGVDSCENAVQCTCTTIPRGDIAYCTATDALTSCCYLTPTQQSQLCLDNVQCGSIAIPQSYCGVTGLFYTGCGTCSAGQSCDYNYQCISTPTFVMTSQGSSYGLGSTTSFMVHAPPNQAVALNFYSGYSSLHGGVTDNSGNFGFTLGPWTNGEQGTYELNASVEGVTTNMLTFTVNSAPPPPVPAYPPMAPIGLALGLVGTGLVLNGFHELLSMRKRTA